MKTVIEMAREAGIRDCTCNGTFGCLERFAELVRADERRAMMQLFTDPENQPTQRDALVADVMAQLDQIAERRGVRVKAERSESGLHCAAVIRARSVS